MSTLSNLLKYTTLFFELHWDEEKLGKAPIWSERHNLIGTMPYFDKQGVYAFVQGSEITYIGVGASRGSGRYRGRGLSARVQTYFRYVDGVYQPVDPRLKEAGELVAIGFEIDTSYLANALEIYLIGKLHPKYNFIKSGS